MISAGQLLLKSSSTTIRTRHKRQKPSRRLPGNKASPEIRTSRLTDSSGFKNPLPKKELPLCWCSQDKPANR
jgi:hypothetical protein